MKEATPAEVYDYINHEILPRFIDAFERKQGDYSSAPFLLLGPRGQFANVNRKFWKLYRGVWEGKPLAFEGNKEIAQDMIGHLILMLYCLEAEDEEA